MLCAKYGGKETTFELLYARKRQKHLKKPQKHKLARNFKHMTIIFVSNHLNTITYTNYCCVPSFVANKQCFNHFLREGAKKPKKT